MSAAPAEVTLCVPNCLVPVNQPLTTADPSVKAEIFCALPLPESPAETAQAFVPSALVLMTTGLSPEADVSVVVPIVIVSVKLPLVNVLPSGNAATSLM